MTSPNPPYGRPLAQLVDQMEQDIRTQKLKRLFVTGTDTEVGKTYISATLLKQLRIQAPDLALTARKPIASGCTKCPKTGKLHCEDGYQLYQALNQQTPLELINPYRFEPAVAPSLALQQANQILTTQDLYHACLKAANPLDFTLIEGAGGFYAPISSDGLNSDLAKKLKSPALLVIRDQLGCINHTLLTLQAILDHNLEVYALVLNFFNPNSSNAQMIQQAIQTHFASTFKHNISHHFFINKTCA